MKPLVDIPCIMDAMTATEAAGIPTKFPHPSHLYKVERASSGHSLEPIALALLLWPFFK